MKKNLVVRGFFGRGNCGDEAILQSVFDMFHEKYNIVISTEISDARSIFRQLHPYDKCEVINSEVRSCFDPRKTAGFFLGGGGLGLGLGWNQLIVAKRKEIPVIQAGVHLDDSFVSNKSGEVFSLGEGQSVEKMDSNDGALYNGVVSGFLKMCNYLALRNTKSIDLAKQLNVEAKLYPDLVFGMDKSADTDIQMDKNRIIVIIREYPPNLQNYKKLKKWIDTKIKPYAEKKGMYIKFLPFCDEDALQTQRAGYQAEMIDGQYWNPKRVKQWIANSGLVISMGRFHGVVFAISEGTPIVSIDHVFNGYKNKGWHLLNDSHLEEFHLDDSNIDDDIVDLFDKALSVENRAKVASVGHTNKKLVDKMRDEIIQVIEENQIV